MNPGDYRDRVVFLRRPVIDERTLGDYADLRAAWGSYRRLSGREALQAGRQVDVEEGTLRIRHPGAADDVTNDDRVRVRGREFGIVTVGSADRRDGFVELTIRTDVDA